MADVAAFLSHTKELDTTPVPQLIITDCGVHWILPTVENGETVVSQYLIFYFLFIITTHK